MNDIWALPSGEWVVYTDEGEIIKDFLTLADLKVVTSYHGMIRKHKAMQFRFPNREDLLRYICLMSRFNYSLALRLRRHPGTGYNCMFDGHAHQPPLFAEVNPRRKKKRKKESDPPIQITP